MRDMAKHKQWCHEYYIRVTKPKRHAQKKVRQYIHRTEEEKITYRREYHKRYYINVTKPKRQLHRKRLHKRTEEDRKRYQHEYYMNITKPKRLAKRLAKGQI